MIASIETTNLLSAKRFATMLDWFEVVSRDSTHPQRKFDALLHEFASTEAIARKEVVHRARRGVTSSERLLKQYESGSDWHRDLLRTAVRRWREFIAAGNEG